MGEGINKTIVTIATVMFIFLLCELFPDIFKHNFFILYYLVKLSIDKTWDDL